MSAATLLLLWTVGLAAGSRVKTQHYNRRLPKAELRFGLKLLRELSPAGHTGGRNTLFSPAGISAAGAGGKSEKQLSNVLGYEKVGLNTRDKVMRAYNQSLADFQSPGAALDIANAALIDESFSVLDGYKKDLVRTFDAWLCSVDFIDNSNGVTSEINDWVRAKTNGMIPKMINEDVDSNVLLLLLNAIYFKGSWHYAFDPSKTKLLPFYDYRSQAHPVETMRSVVKLSHVALGSLKSQTVELRYSGGRYSMIILLPDERLGVSHLRKEVCAEELEKLSKKLRQKHRQKPVEIHLPKFELDTEYGLVPVLKNLGLTSIFEINAELWGISAVVVSDVRHAVAVKVSKNETVASAASNVRKPVKFHADHPFLFFIHEYTKRLVLFIGEVLKL